jgi:hypothetical protein
MKTYWKPLSAAALSLSLVAVAPAVSAGGPDAEVAAKCKNRRLAVGGVCVPTFKGKPAAIRVAIRGSNVVFRWAPLRCGRASGLPPGTTKNAKVKNRTIRIDSPIGRGYRVRFLGQLVTSTRMNGQASISRSGRGVVCFRAIGLKRS